MSEPVLSSRGPPLLPCITQQGFSCVPQNHAPSPQAVHVQREQSWGEGQSKGRMQDMLRGFVGAKLKKKTPTGLMAASVWMTSWMGLPVLPLLISRPIPLITPVVSVWSRPKGLPMAYTRWPTCRRTGVGGGGGVAWLPVFARGWGGCCAVPAVRAAHLESARGAHPERSQRFLGVGLDVQHGDILVLVVPHYGATVVAAAGESHAHLGGAFDHCESRQGRWPGQRAALRRRAGSSTSDTTDGAEQRKRVK